MTSRFSASWRIAILLTFGSASVLASGGKPVDIPERIKGSQKVVVAHASGIAPSWRTNAHGDHLIVSEVTLQIEETLKGPLSTVLMMELEGGTVDGVTLHVSSLPEMKVGDRGVFFLDQTATGSHKPHLNGMGILKLDAKDQVRGSSLKLDDIRRAAQDAK